MRGIVCAEIERFQAARDLPEPILEPGRAIVAIRRIGICGTDLHAFKGRQPFFVYPRILGHELAGIIQEIGPNEQGLRIGDQVSVIPYMHCGSCIACRNGKTNCCTEMKVLGVHIDGGMRERISVPVTHLIRANDLTLDQTATLEPFAIGAHAVRRSGLAAGETALVIGGGPIGLGVMAFAKSRGAKVVAMDVNRDRLAFCRDWARADATVNALEDPLGQVLAANGGELPSVVFDATGNAQSMAGAFGYAAHGGTLVYVGLVGADISFHDPEFHKRELTLMGSRNATREDFERVLEAMASGAIDVGRYITHRAAFDDMIGRFEDWLEPESKVIKAMVEL
ncbi:zinc-binding alcohol dehydrogenase family protein [Cohnella thailandensis]|uniref:Zinc-binding alcohol dehydrogenase family protein n=1 Tax=Cohnella thailandensis TaxID=557557 RepID=A0A841SQ63_9BACL|nr:zinc-binding alcohol dehydrogenase family protein [Cohnella thailandensis]MBB6634553.1 zinc-binding alcohol dehydrogenase family protein [Cohnella thailandensis]MBP1972892.1 2-desacetyl-2-hydroxyethyl bacteriochlorophyllide A dehydrogenase [Cohnella thailandensis]